MDNARTRRGLVMVAAGLVIPAFGCAASTNSTGVDAGEDAPVAAHVDAGGTRAASPGGGALSAGDDAGSAATSCGTPLDGEGCSCAPGSTPRSCYTGPAAQAGVGSCTLGHQVCSSEGESGGVWGACTGSGAPTTSCASSQATCGTLTDGCGGALDCGACPSGQTCGATQPNQCGAGSCVPTTTCASLGLQCGAAADNCGNALDCGSCGAGQTCGGGGAPNQCHDTCVSTTTCATLGYACGAATDNCGNPLDCGGCPGSQTCGGGGTANQCGGGATTCGALQQGCWGCGDAMNTTAASSAAECQAYCNTIPGTVCCDWMDDSSSFCFANTDPACKTPTTNTPGTDCTVTGWSCVDASGMPDIWATTCE